MTAHQLIAWCDDTSWDGHPMRWRVRCSCHGLPRDPGWRPAWAGPTRDLALLHAFGEHGALLGVGPPGTVSR